MAIELKPFWADVNLDPKRSFRWVFFMGNLIQPWLIRSVKKPSFSVGNVAHQYINHTFFYPGRVSWSPIDVSFVDPGGVGEADSADQIMQAVKEMGWLEPRLGSAATTSISKSRANAALGEARIVQIDADGNQIEQWELFNPWVTNVDFGSLDYGSEEMVTISMSIQNDWAEFSK